MNRLIEIPNRLSAFLSSLRKNVILIEKRKKREKGAFEGENDSAE